MAQDTQLRRSLGLRESIALGVGGTIGGGIFVLIGTAAGAAGPGVLVSFLLAFAGALLIALPYAELACRYPLAGGGYAPARALFGPHWGFLMGWGYWGGYLFVSGYVTLGFGGYFHAITGLPTTVGALGLIGAITAMNLAGVRLSGQVQSLIVVLALIALVSFGVLGLPSIAAENFTPLFPNGPRGVFVAALLAFLAFGGFDMVAAAGEEVSAPDRNLPRAILLTLLIVLGLYLFVAFVAVGVLAWDQLGASPAPLAEAASVFLGPAGQRITAVVALLTTAATANAVLVVTSRIAFAMARDGLMPRPIAAVHAVTQTPWVAIVLCGSLLALVTFIGSIAFAASIGGFLYVLHFVPPLIALAVLRRRDTQIPAFQTPMPHLVLPLSIGGCILLLLASGVTGIIGGGAWLLVGGLIYGLSHMRIRAKKQVKQL